MGRPIAALARPEPPVVQSSFESLEPFEWNDDLNSDEFFANDVVCTCADSELVSDGIGHSIYDERVLQGNVARFAHACVTVAKRAFAPSTEVSGITPRAFAKRGQAVKTRSW